MANNAESTGGVKRRPTRSAKKKTTVVAAEETPEADIILHGGDPVQNEGSMFNRGRVRHAEITVFLRQLIMLLEAGTPILRSLRTLSARGKSPALRGLVSDITQYVEAGNPLWQAFDRHPRYFDSIFVNLIKASEASGTLVVVLRRMVEFREKRELMDKRIRGAMIYPVILVAACLGVLMLLTHFVVPQFKSMFESADLTLPKVTEYFFYGSDIVAVWWWVPLALLILLVVVYKVWYRRNPLRRLRADRIKIKIPIAGSIAHKNAIVELTRTLALLLRSGLSMMASLDLARNAIHNRAVAQSLQDVRNSVEQGGGLEEPLRANEDVIPAVVTDMLVTGEESGRVDQVCDQIANVYEEEVEISLNTLGETLQPVITIFIAIIVIALFIALFVPLISMIDQISGAGL
jgi:type IV pilus assembly protein PilC